MIKYFIVLKVELGSIEPCLSFGCKTRRIYSDSAGAVSHRFGLEVPSQAPFPEATVAFNLARQRFPQRRHRKLLLLLLQSRYYFSHG